MPVWKRYGVLIANPCSGGSTPYKSAAAGAGRHQLAERAGDPLRGHPAQSLGRQPHLGRGAGAIGADVSVADVLAAGAFGPGLAQSSFAACRRRWPYPLTRVMTVAGTSRSII